MAALKVYVDPGHGGSDPGASGNCVCEKDVALAIAQKVAEHLRRCGAEVKLSRAGDVTKSLQARTDEANAWGAGAYVSIHCNAAASPDASGWEVWHTIHEAQSKGDELAEAIAAQLRRLPLVARGTKSRESQANPGRDYYHVIRETRMPAVIVECGFVSNPKDAAYLKSADGQAAIAEAIARGVVEWGGIVWKPTAEPAPKPAASDDGLYRLKTGTFPDAESLAAARKRVQSAFGWATYEWAEGEYRAGGIWSPSYRIFTGTFRGRAAAEAAADQLRKATGWTVYVVPA